MIATRRLFARWAVGDWFVDKYIDQQRKHGTLKTAANMRKQGVPIEHALAILVPGAKERKES